MIEKRYIPGYGPLGAKIVFVGESPSIDGMHSGRPFTGPEGKELDRLCRDAGINRGDCWITNVCKHFVTPPPRDKKIPFQTRARTDGIDLEQQILDLRNEIQQIDPNIVVALGNTALWALTGKTKISSFRGSLLMGNSGHKLISTYHPAHLLHGEGELKGYWNRQVMVLDFKRALNQSHFRELVLPRRLLSVCKSSSQLFDFIHRYRKHDRPACDIEAIHCIPGCIGLAFTPDEGITVPLWNCNGLSSIPDAELVTIWATLAEFLANQDIVGQNFGYDRDKIKRLGFIIRRLASDTMYKSFAINPELPKNLAFNTSIYTEEPFYKDEGMYEGSNEDLLLGCARDSCVTKEIDLKMDADIDELGMREWYENFVLKLHDLYSHIESQGLKVDFEKRGALVRKYTEWDEKDNFELHRIAGDYINTSSPKMVATLLYENWKIPYRAGTGEEVLTQLLNHTVKDPERRKGIELILEDRRVKKTLSTYLGISTSISPSQKIGGLPDFDGRMRTSYFACLETGRTSTNQQEPPIRPFVKINKNQYTLGSAFQTFTKHGDIGSDVREQYVADKGEVFIQLDSSQAEARVVALLANDEEMLRMYDEHDIHALTASWFFGGSESDYSKKILGYESPFRFAGKTLRHAGHLGAGKRRASIELNTQARKAKIDYQISEAMAGQALDIFHKRAPSIKKVFHFEVIKALEKTRRLYAPVPFGVNAKLGGVRTFFERWDEELFRQAFSYIPQRAVSDNTKNAGMRILARAPWIRILVEAHDALLLSVPIERKREAARIGKQEMERPICFENCSLPRRDLVIPCDIEEGYDYKNLGKFR